MPKLDQFLAIPAASQNKETFCGQCDLLYKEAFLNETFFTKRAYFYSIPFHFTNSGLPYPDYYVEYLGVTL